MLYAKAQMYVNPSGTAFFDNNISIGGVASTNTLAYINKTYNGLGNFFGLKSYIITGKPSIQKKIYYAVCGNIQCDTATNHLWIPPAYFGVVGITNKGVGVYGGIQTNYPTLTYGKYAGYFSGNVKVTSTLTAATITTTSDLRLKSDIEDFTKTDLLYRLNPVIYKYKSDSTNFFYESDAQELKKNHYGLLAQEVEQILPDIVYKNEQGFLSVNYIELVPMLIQAVKELKDQNNLLQKQIDDLGFTNVKKKNISTDNISIVPILFQNSPNPFSQDTEIYYSLPYNTIEANLYVYDMSGVQLLSFSINDFGERKLIHINAEQLHAGMYLYTLVADGEIIDTKRMILTK